MSDEIRKAAEAVDMTRVRQFLEHSSAKNNQWVTLVGANYLKRQWTGELSRLLAALDRLELALTLAKAEECRT